MISGMVRQLLPYAPQVKRALYAKLATALFLKALRQVVDSTVGDVVQLVRTLPRHWLESHTVTAEPSPCSKTHGKSAYIKDAFREQLSLKLVAGPQSPVVEIATGLRLLTCIVTLAGIISEADADARKRRLLW